MSRPDEELVASARGGDNEAFGVLIERHQDAVATTVAAMLGSTPEVDDVVQDTMIRFYNSLHSFRGEASVLTYLKRIAVNLSLDALRARKRWYDRFVRQDDEASLADIVDENRLLEDNETNALVNGALASLSPPHRAVVVLRMIDGYSTEETAAMLDVPYGTVLSRLSRGLDKLKALLEPYMEEE